MVFTIGVLALVTLILLDEPRVAIGLSLGLVSLAIGFLLYDRFFKWKYRVEWIHRTLEDILESKYLSFDDRLKASERYASVWESLNPEEARRAYEKIGIEYFRYENYEQAIRLLNKALALEPGSPEALHYKAGSLGYLPRKRKDKDKEATLREALDLSRRATQFDPENWKYKMGLAWLLDEIGDYREAIRTLGEAIPLSPRERRPKAIYNTVCAYVKLHRHDKALELLEKIAKERGIADIAPLDEDLAPLRDNPEFRRLFPEP